MATNLRTLRRVLHLAARTLGDVNAAKRGRLHKRLVHRHVTRRALRPWNRIFR